MSKKVQTCIVFIETLIDWIGKLVSWLTLIMVLITTLIVILRYLFDTGWIAMQESVLYMHALVFMLGAAYTFKHNGHVRVDIFYQRCHVKTKAWIDLLGTLFLLIPFAVFIIWSSWEYVSSSWVIQESSRNSGGLPGVYLLKSCILIMATLLIFQGIAGLLHNVLIITGTRNNLETRNG